MSKALKFGRFVQLTGLFLAVMIAGVIDSLASARWDTLSLLVAVAALGSAITQRLCDD